jgi:hypothetical protein
MRVFYIYDDTTKKYEGVLQADTLPAGKSNAGIKCADGRMEYSGVDIADTGDFALDQDWTKGTGWTIAAGVASCDGTQTADSDLSQTPTVILKENFVYKITIDTSNVTAGILTVLVDGIEVTKMFEDGTVSGFVTALNTGGDIVLRADSDFVGDVDNVKVEQVWVLPDADKEADERDWRDAELSASDWTQLGDVVTNGRLTAQQQTDWATYRQELADMPSLTGFPWTHTRPTRP